MTENTDIVVIIVKGFRCSHIWCSTKFMGTVRARLLFLVFISNGKGRRELLKFRKHGQVFRFAGKTSLEKIHENEKCTKTTCPCTMTGFLQFLWRCSSWILPHIMNRIVTILWILFCVPCIFNIDIEEIGGVREHTRFLFPFYWTMFQIPMYRYSI